jgi:hypothetical protein
MARAHHEAGEVVPWPDSLVYGGMKENDSRRPPLPLETLCIYMYVSIGLILDRQERERERERKKEKRKRHVTSKRIRGPFAFSSFRERRL